MNRIKPLLAGRQAYEPLLRHWVGVKGFGHESGPRRREPWLGANQPFKLWVKTLAAAGVPYLEMYALRHSSIVRQLRAGLPVRLVAANHDTSSIMIERHYAAYVVSVLDDLTRQAIVPIASAEVRAIRAVG